MGANTELWKLALAHYEVASTPTLIDLFRCINNVKIIKPI